MSGSSKRELSDNSLMVAAMAYRVKYRKVDSNGKAIKVWLRIENMGVHKKNRGGIYPAGVRCKSLCVEVVGAGFVKEEVGHAVIAVEEPPVAEFIRMNPYSLVSASAYNAAQCCKDELLMNCFQTPYDNVNYNLLSHNHMMLVLRAFLTQAKWDLPHDEMNDITFCDADGKLCVTAVAASANGKEAGEVLSEGIPVEVLSWKMDVEEPDAASIISQAQNQPQQMGMRTTELTAVAVLKGEIIVQLGKNVSQRVAFQTVRDRVRSQLHTAADDPDLPEVFEFLISNGVGTNAYVDHLLEWTGIFVDSGKRQLRFAAFAVVNKMHAQAVLSRTAVIKRAYRSKPTNGFCPSPESRWAEFSWSHLQLLEELLRFFHVSCKGVLADLPPQSRIALLGNIDVVAAEAFWFAKDPKMKYADEKIRAILLAGTKKYLEPLGMKGDVDKVRRIKGRAEWILWEEDKPQLELTASSSFPGGYESAPSVINFDEATGDQLNRQMSFALPTASKCVKATVKLPWREWRMGPGVLTGQNDADKAAAVAALHSLHEGVAVDVLPIEIWDGPNGAMVTATTKVKPNAIMLPPGVLKQGKVLDRSEHPYAVRVLMKAVRPVGQAGEDHEDGKILRVRTYFANPEFKAPKAIPPQSRKGDAPPEPEWEWQSGDHTMSPFWAVRRLTAKQLAREVGLTTPGKARPRFNCDMEVYTVTSVSIAVACAPPNCTRIYEVPFLVNTHELAEGEELILEVQQRQPKEKDDITWKQLAQHEDKARKSAAVADKKTAATASQKNATAAEVKC